MAKIIKCWRLDCVGEQHNSEVARFSSREEAEKAKPYAGGYGGEVVPETLVIYDSTVEWNPKTDTATRDAALSKLTEHEKFVLGIIPKRLFDVP
jgi:hypothetical protein